MKFTKTIIHTIYFALKFPPHYLVTPGKCLHSSWSHVQDMYISYFIFRLVLNRLVAMSHMKKVFNSDLNCIKKVSNLLLTDKYSWTTGLLMGVTLFVHFPISGFKWQLMRKNIDDWFCLVLTVCGSGHHSKSGSSSSSESDSGSRSLKLGFESPPPPKPPICLIICKNVKSISYCWHYLHSE